MLKLKFKESIAEAHGLLGPGRWRCTCPYSTFADCAPCTPLKVRIQIVLKGNQLQDGRTQERPRGGNSVNTDYCECAELCAMVLPWDSDLADNLCCQRIC